MDECADVTCENGGTCRNLYGTFQCSCPPGTSGPLCETNINECSSSPCNNGGTCRDLIGGFQCACAPGFTGRQCEADMNECLSQPCSGSGAVACVQRNQEPGYLCICMDGWTGTRCETRTSRCLENRCRNGGRCLELPSSTPCECPAVYNILLYVTLIAFVSIIIFSYR